MMLTREFRPGDLVWFDPGVGYVLPGEVVEFHRAAQVGTFKSTFCLLTFQIYVTPHICLSSNRSSLYKPSSTM